jgi:hypothetical protein
MKPVDKVRMCCTNAWYGSAEREGGPPPGQQKGLLPIGPIGYYSYPEVVRVLNIFLAAPLLMHCEQTYALRGLPSISTRIFCRFGSQRRFETL